MPHVTSDLPEASIGTSEVVLTVGTKEYRVGKHLFTGDYSDIYECVVPSDAQGNKGGTWYDRILEEDGPTLDGVIKIAKDTSYNDLGQNEAKILEKLFPKQAGDVKFYRYLPRLLETFELPVSGRQAVVLPLFREHLTLKDILQAYPTGIDFRDMVWMFKRTLVGTGFVHKNGVVHGAILPDHVLVHPTGHGAKLLDWSFAIEAGDHIRGISGGYSDYYPPEVFDKEKALPATDIYMTAKCAVALLGGNVVTNEMPTTVPKEIQVFLERCLVKNPHRRLSDAWDVHEQFDVLLQKLVGKPTYRPFAVPTTESTP